MSKRVRTLAPYGLAVAAALIATWLRMLLTPYIGDRVPFGVYFFAVMVVAWYAGVGPALLTLILGTVLAAHLFIPPHDSLIFSDLPALLALGVYFVVGIASTLLCGSLRRAQYQARNVAVEIAELNEKLQEADRRKDEFLAMLAHELRSPLAPMQSGLELLRTQALEGSLSYSTTEAMERQLRQVVRLVNDLFDVSRFLHGRIDLERKLVDILDVVRTALETADPAIQRNAHTVDVKLPPGPVWLEGDHVRLAQVVSNLVHNAAKYTPRGGVVSLSVESSSDWAVLRVKDNGIGIEASMLPDVFDLFSQADHGKAKREGGMGLGLAIVQRLVLVHGGSVTARSEGLGKGSEFIVRLPLAGYRAAGVLAEDGASSGRARSIGVRRRILVVDDNHEAANLLARLLKMHGHDACPAYDADSAIDAALQMKPDVAILDIGLPGVDGYDLARLLRQQPTLERMQLVALTGFDSSEDLRRSKEVGFDHHLVKPVSIAELQKALL